ncbi:hypothetical protein KIH27_08955 [Mycobacterium sp. M1]|uniref:ESX-1 scaffolding and assembly protein SaeA n=1 Tax=Mycolicibacter acidiphilus TaxID=2835306 RepID=A0ABS5RHD4_9MYCO|nr:hypothetical protein [Mycolicibacter acidiphilus]MBS9533713.1 hypothetical protein [Mycolicibacter acidiphilus]
MPDPRQHSGEHGDPRMAALIAWRQRLVDSGAVSPGSFKEAHLRMILRSGSTQLDQLRAMLPGSVAAHAEELAALLAQTPAPAPDPDGAAGRHHRATPSATEPGPAVDEPAGERPAAAASPDAPLSVNDFAPFTFGQPSGHVEAIAVGAPTDSGRRLTWPAVDGSGESVVIYRLVAADDSAPYAPDRARLVAATTGTETVDDAPLQASIRYYQVWANVGASRAEALAAQPFKHAEGVVVGPVRDCVVREDNGRVAGRWSAPAGVSTVFVFRIPASDGGRERPEHRILAGQDNIAGFVDVDTEPGQSYIYRVRAAAAVEGVLRLSDPVDTVIDTAAVLTPVTDLQVAAEQGDADVFALEWTPPAAGEVVIFRSQNGPSVGADAGELPEAALEQIGLTAEMRLNQLVIGRRGENGEVVSVMTGVSWPPGWSRAYFTPVTVMAGRVLLGRTFSTVRTGAIRDVDLAEYCNKQVLTFDWPEGAAAVVVYLAPKGYDPQNGLTGTSFEISSEEYDKYGGLQLPNGKLPLTGCSLHLVPVAFSAGRRVTGAVRSIEYSGLLRLQYVVQVERDPTGAPSHAKVFLRSQIEMPGSPAFVLVNNPERIPLTPSDGEAIDAAPVDAAGQLTAKPSKELRWSALTTTGTDEAWAADLRGRRGWIRLFVNTPSAQRLASIALLDPPVQALRLTGGQM